MAKTYSWFQENPPEEDVEQRTIIAAEPTYIKDALGNYVEKDTEEEKFTTAQKEGELADIDRQIASLEEQKAEKVTEIAKIKTALGITEEKVAP